MNNPQGNTVSEVGASTPGPWKIYDDDDDLRVKILGVRPDTGSEHVATVLGKANAELIVRAVNAHDDMLDALREVQHSLRDIGDGWGDGPYLMTVVTSAIAKAEAVGDRTAPTTTAADA